MIDLLLHPAVVLPVAAALLVALVYTNRQIAKELGQKQRIKADPLASLKDYARLIPPRLGSAVPSNVLDGGALIAIDRHGRVFQIVNANISGGGFTVIPNGRTALLEVMDRLSVQDLPECLVTGGE